MRTIFALLLASTACLLAAQPARAGIDWSYIGDKEVKISSGGSVVTFHGTAGSAANNTGVSIFNLTASSSTSNDDVPDHFGATPFTLNVSIVDEKARSTLTGNELGTVTFKGYFTADVTAGSLTNWGVSWDVDKGSVLLGNATVGKRKYDISVDGFLPPSPNNPSVNGQGIVHAHVTVSSITVVDDPNNPNDPPGGDGGPEPSETPEPTSLLLAGLGASGLFAWRRRREHQ